MIYDLPEHVEISGTQYEINSDFRCALDIFEVMNDTELTGRERGAISLAFFYKDFDTMPPEHYEQAVKSMLWFLRGGSDEPTRKQKKLMDWEQDFPYIIAPVNRIIGHDVRSDVHFHWWTFLAAYMEIGDCLFGNIIRVRQMKAEGKKLDKTDAEWYRRNRDIVDIKAKYTDTETDLLKLWGGSE